MINLFNFRKKQTLSIQGFGKLPFYKDYISVLRAPEALRWQEWLLECFSKKKWRVPLGQWPFIFHLSPRSNMVIGIIEPGTDGIREFPFTLFSVLCDYGFQGQNDWKVMVDIWDELKNIRNDLAGFQDIDSFYAVLRSQSISMHSENNKKIDHNAGNAMNFFESFSSWNQKWPAFLIISDIPKQEYLIHNSVEMTDAFLMDWEGLKYNA